MKLEIDENEWLILKVALYEYRLVCKLNKIKEVMLLDNKLDEIYKENDNESNL